MSARIGNKLNSAWVAHASWPVDLVLRVIVFTSRLEIGNGDSDTYVEPKTQMSGENSVLSRTPPCRTNSLLQVRVLLPSASRRLGPWLIQDPGGLRCGRHQCTFVDDHLR